MDIQIPGIRLGTLIWCSIDSIGGIKTHNNDSIRLCRTTEKLKTSKLPFTTGGKEYRADANSAVGGIARGIDERKGILESISMKRPCLTMKQHAYSRSILASS